MRLLNVEGQIPVFISPRNRLALLYSYGSVFTLPKVCIVEKLET
jgi:hypothetical protein